MSCVFQNNPPTISELFTVVAGHYSSGGKGGTEQNNHQLWTYSFQPHNPGHDLQSPIAFMHWLGMGDIPVHNIIVIIGIVDYHIASIVFVTINSFTSISDRNRTKYTRR